MSGTNPLKMLTKLLQQQMINQIKDKDRPEVDAFLNQNDPATGDLFMRKQRTHSPSRPISLPFQLAIEKLKDVRPAFAHHCSQNLT